MIDSDEKEYQNSELSSITISKSESSYLSHNPQQDIRMQNICLVEEMSGKPVTATTVSVISQNIPIVPSTPNLISAQIGKMITTVTGYNSPKINETVLIILPI